MLDNSTAGKRARKEARMNCVQVIRDICDAQGGVMQDEDPERGRRTNNDKYYGRINRDRTRVRLYAAMGPDAGKIRVRMWRLSPEMHYVNGTSGYWMVDPKRVNVAVLTDMSIQAMETPV